MKLRKELAPILGSEYFLQIDYYKDNSFDVVHAIRPPLGLLNSFYWMDHDSSDNCYCKFFKEAQLSGCYFYS